MATPDFSQLPSVHALSQHPKLQPDSRRLSDRVRVTLVQQLIAQLRADLVTHGKLGDESDWLSRLEFMASKLLHGGIRRVINATGVVLHTNLGRAPVGEAVLKAMGENLGGYCNLEWSLAEAERGDRSEYLEQGLKVLTGAPAVAVVNNNAAALVLCLQALASGKPVAISRGEMVQIGGGFKIPEILKTSGAHLVEVGTTNITALSDYEAVLTPETGLILKVHQSNFVMEGHVHAPQLESLAACAKRFSIPLLVDLGSGWLGAKDLEVHEPSLTEVLAAGASLITFSGDKLLGGAQAGFIVGDVALVAQVKRHPLYRALRLGKMEIFVLEHLVKQKLQGQASLTESLLAIPVADLKVRAENFKQALGSSFPIDFTEGYGAVGGGASPQEAIASVLLVVRHEQADLIEKQLRTTTPPVICRREKGALLFDLRTVLAEEDELLISALKEVSRCLS